MAAGRPKGEDSPASPPACSPPLAQIYSSLILVLNILETLKIQDIRKEVKAPRIYDFCNF